MPEKKLQRSNTMNKFLTGHLQMFVVVIGSLFIMMLFSACQGFAIPGTNGTTGSATLIGQVQSVNASAHSVTLTVNGQQLTVNGLTDQQVALLQSQQGKRYSIQVTQAGTNTYTISTNTQPQETDSATPGVINTMPENNAPENTNNGVNEPGTIEFEGKVQSVNNNNITVGLPDGQGLSMNIVNGQTDEGDLNGAQLTVGQIVKATATANTSDGSFTASKLDIAKPDETQNQNTVKYQGYTTSAVGSDNKLNFKVGNKSFSYSIVNGADLKDFNYSAQSIGNNVPVKVKVAFNNGTGTVVSVDNGNH